MLANYDVSPLAKDNVLALPVPAATPNLQSKTKATTGVRHSPDRPREPGGPLP